jgi:hypothetical protein
MRLFLRFLFEMAGFILLVMDNQSFGMLLFRRADAARQQILELAARVIIITT